MGCAGSKLEDLEAVALCRGRTDILADAIRHRYALADAHAAYADSLRSIGASLHRLLDNNNDPLPPSSPVLPLPTQRKGDPLPPPSPTPPPPTSSVRHSDSHSGSGSHIQFHSSDDSDSDGDDSPLHSNNSSPHHHFHHDGAFETLGPTYVNLNYARNQPPAPSVSYEHRPGSLEFVHFASTAEPSSSSPPPHSNYGYPYPNPYPYPHPDAYPPNYYGYGGIGGAFFGSSSPPPTIPPPPSAVAATGSSSSKAPPPPPSPPRTSTWDFLNPFESQDSYYPPYTPSRSSKEVRDEEGIPDLEEEEYEVVKEAYGDQKFVASTFATSPEEYSTKAAATVGENSHYQTSSVKMEDETDVVEKNVVGEEVPRPHEERWNVVASSNPRRYRDVSEIGNEIKVQFDRASESATEFSRMLEVGKHPYRHWKSSVYEVSSRIMCVMPPFTSKSEDFLNYEDDMVTSSGNLSSTLQKLYIWEKKLQDEVRAEEKMRLLHERNCKRLKHLAERGAESHKLEDIQTLIRKLSTKIRIAIQVVDSISNKINKLRDEELLPQIIELIQGLVRMWKVMLECHRIQCQAISEARSLDSIASGGKISDTRMSAMMQFELELLRWIGNFSAWINAQKDYVKALNGWLILCLHYEPEVTADGVAPYSPGRIGAPPVFVICNYWSQAMDRISEKEVIVAMQAFATKLRHLWEQHSVEQHQKMMPITDMDRWVKAREREAQIIHKEVDALNRKLILVSGQNELTGHTAEASSLQLGLRQLFEAMENFAANSLKVYEELCVCSQEERVARENAKVS